jgi:hypothetical protein
MKLHVILIPAADSGQSALETATDVAQEYADFRQSLRPTETCFVTEPLGDHIGDGHVVVLSNFEMTRELADYAAELYIHYEFGCPQI